MAKASAGGYGPAGKTGGNRTEPYEVSEFSTPAQSIERPGTAESLAPAPPMPPVNDPNEFMNQLLAQMGQLMDSKLDSKFNPVVAQLTSRMDLQDSKISKIESEFTKLQSKFDDISTRDVPMGGESKDSSTIKAEILAELQKSSSIAKPSKSAPASPRGRNGGKCAYSQSEVDSAMLRLEFQVTTPWTEVGNVESKVFGMIQEKCPDIVKPKVVKSAFKYPNQESTRIHIEFESKEDRNGVRNAFRRKNEELKWESAVKGVEVWCPEPAFMFARNRPLFEMRRLIASQKGIPVQSVKVDKSARKLWLDGKVVATQNLSTWQVAVSDETSQ